MGARDEVTTFSKDPIMQKADLATPSLRTQNNYKRPNYRLFRSSRRGTSTGNYKHSRVYIDTIEQIGDEQKIGCRECFDQSLSVENFSEEKEELPVFPQGANPE